MAENQIKVSKKGVVLLLVAVGLLASVIYINIFPMTRSYEEVYDDAVVAFNDSDYKTSYELLQSIEDVGPKNDGYQFYSYIAQASYLNGDIDSARSYAQKGVQSLTKSTDKGSATLFIFESIIKETYMDDPIKNAPKYSIPEEKANEPGFQG